MSPHWPKQLRLAAIDSWLPTYPTEAYSLSVKPAISGSLSLSSHIVKPVTSDLRVGLRGFGRWAEILEHPGVHVAQWTSVKSAERALEKLVRSYDMDPSRLLDTCRETLAYDHPAEIAAALDSIVADRELVVVRVKNRPDPDPDL